jgi:transcriptional regulator GlxA family with amidase domain
MRVAIRRPPSRLRIDRLKRMVQETDQPLSVMAYAFGFSTAGQFSRYFSRAVGMPPSTYRKKFEKRKGDLCSVKI